MINLRKGAISMTNVLTNMENIIDDYEVEKKEKINLKLKSFFIVYKIKRILKTDFAQKIISENIIKDKAVNNGRETIKGTRITPDDIGRIVAMNKNVTIENIFEELPSLKNQEQILAGLFVFMRKNITWRNLLFAQ